MDPGRIRGIKGKSNQFLAGFNSSFDVFKATLDRIIKEQIIRHILKLSYKVLWKRTIQILKQLYPLSFWNIINQLPHQTVVLLSTVFIIYYFLQFIGAFQHVVDHALAFEYF